MAVGYAGVQGSRIEAEEAEVPSGKGPRRPQVQRFHYGPPAVDSASSLLHRRIILTSRLSRP